MMAGQGVSTGTPGGGTAKMVVLALAAMASLVGVSAVVVTSSIAAFTDSTSTSGNSFTAGTVDLIDDDLDAVMFSVPDLVPGQAVSDCILVTYQGTVADPAAVKLYSGGYTDSGDLGTYLNLTIEEGNGGSFGNCAGFVPDSIIEMGGTLADFDTTHTDYATGAGLWDPAATPDTKTYRVTVSLDAAAPDSEQGESVTALTFAWEVQS
ncbi:MAG: hypothetical protein HKN26_10780 [Acidimicrobiales bacterium]|nr:hypothetical protein [Acidimicrobiales bacterium]